MARTAPPMKILRLLPLLLLATWLAACGDLGAIDDARVRLVNATSDGYEQLDLLLDGDREIAAVAAGSVSAYTGVDDGEYTVALARPPSTTPLAAAQRTLADDTDHTVVAYGRVGSLKTVMLVDDEPRPDSGKAKLRVLNAGSDAGALDVYLTAPGDALDDASAVAAGVAADATSDFATLNAARYRLRVTAAGDRDDLRLDVDGVALDSRRVATLLLTGTPGGVLVNAALVNQGGALQNLPTAAARVRVVAAIGGGARVNVRAGERLLAADVASPQIGAYTLLPAGTHPLGVGVAAGGTELTLPALPLLDAAAGADLTLLVAGTVDAPVLRVIADDNRRPTAADKAKLRVLHAVAGLDEAIALSVGFTPLGSAAFGEASAPVQHAAGSDQLLAVTSPTPPTVKFADPDVTLDAGGVYTVFLLGSAADMPASLAGSVRKDR